MWFFLFEKKNYFSIQFHVNLEYYILGSHIRDNFIELIAIIINLKLSLLVNKWFYTTSDFAWFFEAQFRYCPLIWLCCGWSANNKISMLHERALRIAYDDYNSKFEEILSKDGSSTINRQNVLTLAIKMFKNS